MIPYKTSRDYSRLKQLLDEGMGIVCFSLKSRECALAKKQTFCDGQMFAYYFGRFHIFNHDLEIHSRNFVIYTTSSLLNRINRFKESL